MDSPDLFWKNTELNENLPKKPKLFEIKNNVEIPHVCNSKLTIEAKVEKKVKCPKCNPLTRKDMPASELQNHVQREHIDWGDYQ
tara:strand:+ start:3249 stop:3500 length:252 start_codon:yes stop_codon:yes gene_type:complete